MKFNIDLSRLPMQLWVLVALYFSASLAHFAHNAEYIVHYPNMPAWLTREDVYLVWMAITGVGIFGLALSLTGCRALGALALAVYGLMGLDGLGHHALALCSEHSIAANLTIWFEVLAGSSLALGCAVLAVKPAMLAWRPFCAARGGGGA